MERTLVMDNLPAWADESYLFQLFQPTQSILSARMARGRSQQGGKHAFLAFSSREAADGVLHAYNGTLAPGCDLKLSLHWMSEYNSRTEGACLLVCTWAT